MADNTAIEWTDATWNPVVGSSIASPGCTNCYAMREAHRLGANPKLHGKYAGLTRVVNGHPVWTGDARLHEAALLQPLGWRKPRRIFVNSMSDLFHEGLTWTDIDRVFTVMAEAHRHTFQVLTKRSWRMKEWANSTHQRTKRAQLPHIWLGVSAEDQTRAEMRISDLLATPAAVRFVSCEPLLEAIDLDRIPREPSAYDRAMPGFAGVGKFVTSALHGVPGLIMADDGREYWEPIDSALRGARLDWVIAGGESGPSARPAHPDWLRSLRDQCVRAGVPYFFKQWGEWEPTAVEPGGDLGGDMRRDLVRFVRPRGENDGHFRRGDVIMRRTGKSKAPAQLDGRTWRESPS